MDEVCLSDDDEDDSGACSQVFGLNDVPQAPKKPKQQFKKRYSDSLAIDEDEHSFLGSIQTSATFLEPTPKKFKLPTKKRLVNKIINLSEKEDDPSEFEKITFFLGKNIFIENTVFKSVPYMCFYRKEDEIVKNRFNIPVELAPVLKKAINMIAEKKNN